MSEINRLKVQTVGFVILAIWSAVETIRTHTNGLVLTPCMLAFVILAMNNSKIIRREHEREKASRCD